MAEEDMKSETPEDQKLNQDEVTTEEVSTDKSNENSETEAEKVEEKSEEPVEMVEVPKKRLEELENAEGIFKDQLMRERAESINYRKRLQKQRDEFAEVASARVLSKVLAIKDDIKRFLDNANGEIPETHIEGIQLIQQRLEGIFTQEGVELIKIEEGKTKYDPVMMEAVVSQVIPGVEPNTVMGVINQGFKKGDRILRAAKVMISKAAEEKKPVETEKPEETSEDEKAEVTESNGTNETNSEN